MPFASNLTHVKNVDMMLQCEEYNSWRLLYSKHNLNRAQHSHLGSILNKYTFTRGASLEDLEFPEGLHVYTQDTSCGEKPYQCANHMVNTFYTMQLLTQLENMIKITQT